MKHFLLAFVLLLAACDQSGIQQNTSSGEAAPAPSIAVGEPNPATPPATCPHQDWVGKNKADVDMSGVKALRVLYPDQPMTMDYNPDRINVILEKGTDKITEVRCG